MTKITKATLTKRYGRKTGHYALGYLKQEGILGEGQKEGRFTKYELNGELPHPSVIDDYLNTKYTTDVESLIDDAFCTIDEVKDELTEWADGMPDNLQGGGKHDEVTEAAGYLESCERPDIPEPFGDLICVFVPDPFGTSRNDRVAEAISQMDTAILTLDSFLDDEGDQLEQESAETTIEMIEQLKKEIEQAKSEAENCECPGMF